MTNLQEFLNFVINSRSLEDIHDATQEFAELEGISIQEFSYNWDPEEDLFEDDLEVDLDWQPLD